MFRSILQVQQFCNFKENCKTTNSSIFYCDHRIKKTLLSKNIPIDKDSAVWVNNVLQFVPVIGFMNIVTKWDSLRYILLIFVLEVSTTFYLHFNPHLLYVSFLAVKGKYLV